MFVVTWSPILVTLLHETVSYAMGTLTFEYYNRFHRCVVSERHPNIEDYMQICLVFVPFLLLILMYGIMLLIIIRKRQRCGRFLATAFGIIITSLLSYSPYVITYIWDIPLSYQASQILTITLYYTNGIVNPLIYVVGHPVILNQIRSWWPRTADHSINLELPENQNSSDRNNLGVAVPLGSLPADIVSMPNMITNDTDL